MAVRKNSAFLTRVVETMGPFYYFVSHNGSFCTMRLHKIPPSSCFKFEVCGNKADLRKLRRGRVCVEENKT